MTLDDKLRRLAAMKREIVALEREIKAEAMVEARAQGLLVLPRIETLMRRVA